MVRIIYVVVAIIVPLLFLTSCGQNETPVVTEVVMIDGQEIVVTRVAQTTVEIAVTPRPDVPVITDNRDPVVLNVAMIDTREAFTLDPYLATDDNTILLIDNLFAGLTHFNAQAGIVEPEIAGSWQVSADGLTWRFYLNPNFYWMNGRVGSGDTVQPVRPVEAEDFVFAWQRACQKETPMPQAFLLFIIVGCQDVYELDNPTAADLVEIGVSAPEPFVLQVDLQEPANYFLTMTSMGYMRPLPREQVQNLGADWALPENIITNGPFFWGDSSLPGTRITLTRNPTWPLPQLGNVDQLNLFQLENRTDAFALWDEMSLDIAPFAGTLTAIERQELGDRLKHIPQYEVFYLGYNLDSPVFRVPEMRHAFGAAIDRQLLLEEVYGGVGFPMRHLSPPGIVGGPPLDVVGTGYSPDYARRQFAAGGFPSCRTITPVTLMTTTSDEALQQAEALRDMWRQELGCADEQIQIAQVQFGTLLANTRRDAAAFRPDMWILGWSAYYPDAYNWLNTVLHCENSENRPDRPCSTVDNLLRQAATTTDPAEAAELYREVERLFFAEEGLEPITPLFMQGRYEVAHIWVQYTPTLMGGPQFEMYEVDTEMRLLERGE